jgi:hypothetical protein
VRKLRAILALQEEDLIRGFRVASSVLILACAFAALAQAGMAAERFSARSPSAAGKAAMPNSDAGARGQAGIANKGGGGIAPAERRQNDCAVPGAAGANKGTDCPPGRAAKEGDTSGPGNVEPAPRRRATPCIGSRDRQCL